jgi:hypothetical protein
MMSRLSDAGLTKAVTLAGSFVVRGSNAALKTLVLPGPM